jgi:hypothetical protein
MGFGKKLLSQTTLAAVLACSSLAVGPGCVARGGYRGTLVARSEPPPPRSVVVEERPGYVWVDGRWNWDDGAGEWVWYDGYYEPQRPGYYYESGRWDHRGEGYVYVQPRWVNRSNPRAYVRVNDHSRPTQVRIRSNSGGRVPARPVIRR